MPKDIIIEPATWDYPVSVPLGSDSRANAAELVEQIAQKLLNRTWWLRSKATLKDAVTLFTGQLTLHDPADSQKPALEFGGGNQGTSWRRRLKCGVGGITEVHMYSGTGVGGPGHFAIVYNAQWSGLQWSQQDTALPSCAWILDAAKSGTFVSYQPAGTSPWASWPTVAGAANVANVNASNVTSNNFTIGSGSVAYASARTRTTVMGCGTPRAGGHNGANGSLSTDGTLSYAYIDLRFPDNWDPSGAWIEIVHHQTTSTPNVFKLAERTINWSSPAAASETYPAQDPGTVSTGYKLATVPLTGVTFDPLKEYRLVWIPGNVSDSFEGWRVVSWKDQGPRARLG